MASSSSAQKIVLKNTTKISLNERFTAYRQQAQNTATFRQKSMKQASVENTRLAQQMARRPTVIAALRLKRRSLQQRLGGVGGQQRMRRNPVKARLDFGSRSTNIYRRLGQLTRGRSIVRRGANRGYDARPGTSPLLKARLGQTRGTANNRRFKKFFASSRNQFQQQMQSFGRGFSSFGKQRRGRGRSQLVRGGRGGRWNRGQQQHVPTKQELDTQLDEYMAESKGPLDSQMGAFVGSNF